MADESTDYSSILSRRRFVELTGVTGAAALAGCDGGDGDTETPGDEDTTEPGGMDTTDPGDGEEFYSDVEHRGGTTVTPSDVQFNPELTEGVPQISHHLLFEKLAQYSYLDGGYMAKGAFADWNFTGDTFEIQLREGLSWSNGEDVTADDVVRMFRIWEEVGHPMWDWASEVEATDDYTVVVSVGSEVNPALIEFDILEEWLRYPADPFDDLMGNTEDLTSTRIDDPVTNGIFQFEEKGDQTMLTSHFEDHPDADNVNFGQYSFSISGDASNPPRQQALSSGDLDSEFSLAAAAPIVADFPDAIEEVRPPGKWGIGLQPNHNSAWTEDRSIRQAIQYVVNREACVQNSLPRAKQAPEYPLGIASDEQEDWLGDISDDLDTYGQAERQTDNATSVLEDDGYSNVDGTWEDSDGNVVVLDVTVPGGWSDWVLVAESVVDQLGTFGFDSSVDSTSSYPTRREEGDFTMIASGWLPGAPTGSYPYYSLREWLWVPSREPALAEYPPWRDNEGDTFGGQEATLTVPARDGSGTIDIDPEERLNTFSTSTDDAEIQEIVNELAWACNVDLPIIPIAEKREQSFFTSDDWAVPESPEEDSDAMVRWAPTWLPQVGKMNYQG